jgi:hypothetical protein
LEDLTANERTMYELDLSLDQIMTICKLALVNLIMWVCDRYFPTTYAQATRASARTFLSTSRTGHTGTSNGSGGAAAIQ